MLSMKQLATKITSISKRRETWNDDVQTVLINMAGHAYEHGDVSKFPALFAATKGADKKAIMRFAVDHCFVNVKADGTVSVNKKARKEADFEDGTAVVTHLEQEAPKWFDDAITTEQAAKALDVCASIKALTKRVAKGDRDVTFTWDGLQAEIDALESALELARQKQLDADLKEAVAQAA